MTEILQEIEKISYNLKWRDIERLARINNWRIVCNKAKYKVYINNSVWTVHIERRTANELKHGIIRELKKILIKENILKIS